MWLKVSVTVFFDIVISRFITCHMQRLKIDQIYEWKIPFASSFYLTEYFRNIVFWASSSALSSYYKKVTIVKIANLLLTTTYLLSIAVDNHVSCHCLEVQSTSSSTQKFSSKLALMGAPTMDPTVPSYISDTRQLLFPPK